MKNRTDSQIAASRANGAKSQGPVTAQGKATSSQNATKLGLYSTRVVLASENQADYDDLLAGYLDDFQPATNIEHDLVVQLANARWRINRIQNASTTQLDLEVDRAIPQVKAECTNPDLDLVHARAHQNAADMLDYHARNEARFERLFDRHLRNLLKLQKDRKAAEAAPKPAPDTIEARPQAAESKNHENEPELISINEAIRRGLIPSLSRNSVPPAKPAAKNPDNESNDDLAA